MLQKIGFSHGWKYSASKESLTFANTATPEPRCATPYLFPIFFSPLPPPMMVTPFIKHAFTVCNHGFSIEII